MGSAISWLIGTLSASISVCHLHLPLFVADPWLHLARVLPSRYNLYTFGEVDLEVSFWEGYLYRSVSLLFLPDAWNAYATYRQDFFFFAVGILHSSKAHATHDTRKDFVWHIDYFFSPFPEFCYIPTLVFYYFVTVTIFLFMKKQDTTFFLFEIRRYAEPKLRNFAK